ncbi:MAG: transposase [Synergistaceae bacterium]|nr:transposase [Synergistaceae bacterium]
MKLSDRVYICQECGLKIDRDLNAAMNLKYCKHYKVV